MTAKQEIPVKKHPDWNPTGLQCAGIVLAMIIGPPLAMALFIYSLGTAFYFILIIGTVLWILFEMIRGGCLRLAGSQDSPAGETPRESKHTTQNSKEGGWQLTSEDRKDIRKAAKVVGTVWTVQSVLATLFFVGFIIFFLSQWFEFDRRSAENEARFWKEYNKQTEDFQKDWEKADRDFNEHWKQASERIRTGQRKNQTEAERMKEGQ